MERKLWKIAFATLVLLATVFAGCKVDAGNSTEALDTTAPGNVTNLLAAAGDKLVTLTWTDATDDDIFGYEITYAGVGNDRSVVGAMQAGSVFVAAGTEKYLAAGLENGVEYAFTVKTMDKSGNKSSGVTETATPAASVVLEKPVTVEYYQQNIEDDDYTVVAADTETGVTSATAKTYIGFHLLKRVNETSASDESTVVKFYYDRNIVTVTFDLDGGATDTALNADNTLTGKYGALMGIKNPTKMGYIFKDWSNDSQGTFPAQDMVYTALWSNDAVQSIELDKTLILVAKRTTIKLNATVTYADGTVSHTAKWTSSSGSASVDDNGNVKIHSLPYSSISTFTITATASSQSASCKVMLLPSKLTQSIFRDLCSELGTTYDKIEEFDIPEGVTTIGESAFRDCSSFTSVTIPEGVTTIGNRAFYGCSKLANVTIPEGVTEIGEYTFGDCSKLASVTIPEGVTTIGNRAFYGCSKLANVTIPEGVTKIGEYTFGDCSKLASVTIPESVTTIGSWAFSGCSSLASVKIPEGVTTIDKSAFDGCSKLTSVTIPESVTTIGSWAFYGCSSLASVKIPEGVTKIGNSAFSGCSSLASVTIPEGVTTIDSNTFGGCSKLTSITIPGNVTEIGVGAFADCYSLTNATFDDPNNWWYTNSKNGSKEGDISSAGLSDNTTAAKYLLSYRYQYWYKGEQ